jgi:hypothetical protein
VFQIKQEGGLGLKRLEVWNQAAMLNHIYLEPFCSSRFSLGGLGGSELAEG